MGSFDWHGLGTGRESGAGLQGGELGVFTGSGCVVSGVKVPEGLEEGCDYLGDWVKCGKDHETVS